MINSLHKYAPRHRDRANRTLEAKFQSLHHDNPQQQAQPRPGRSIPIYLLYKKNKLVIRSSFGMPYSDLTALLVEEIIRWERSQNLSLRDAVLEGKKVLGFSTASVDLKTDYLLSLKQGTVKKSLLLQCFTASKKSNRVLNYQIYNCLAIGGFSKVYLARSREDSRFYAIKFIKKKKQDSKESEKTILNEMRIGQEVSHPFLIEMRESFETPSFYCMVFDYCPGGELFFLLKRIKMMNEGDARFFFLQILMGIQYLHGKKIVYRDLKPQNILIDWQGNAKIVDFGLSKELASTSNRQKTFSYCGSAEYMAPEMVLRAGHSYSIDYYSLGALLYELVTGLPPFYSKDSRELEESIITEDLAFPSHIPLSMEIKDFLCKLLQKDSRFRLGSLAGVRQIVAHPWVGKFKPADVIAKTMSPPFPPDLQQHNFDMDELGDDEEQFTNMIYSEFCRNNKHSTKILCQSKQAKVPILTEEFDRIQAKLIEEDKRQKSKDTMKAKFSSYTTDAESQKIPRQRFTLFRQKQQMSHHVMNFSQRNASMQKLKEAKIRAKLLPYFTKSKIDRPKADKQNQKKLPRTNILKMNIFHNKISPKKE